MLWPNKQNDSKLISDTEGPEKYVQVILGDLLQRPHDAMPTAMKIQ